MKCPFLRDASVKYCEASAFRKMIVKSAMEGAERCSSTDWRDCPAAAPRIASAPGSQHCPFLHQSQAEFCGAASVTKYIPATNDLLSRCNSDGHLYCELYLAHADPQGERRPKPHGVDVDEPEQTPLVDGIPVPQHLSYTPNHMWLDVTEDGYCHIGIDGFAAKVFGRADKVSFVKPRSLGRPVAVLRVNGVDMQMVFPNALHVTAANVYLRTTPEKLTDDPYGTGWLFEGVEPASSALVRPGEAARDGLIDGKAAVHWMRSELDRLNHFAHERIGRPTSDGVSFMADGGVVEDGLAEQLDREGLINLIAEFFASQLTWRR